VQLVLLMLVVAIGKKSRVLLFSWSFLLLSVLPFIFLPHYAALFMYIPSVGWALFAASILVSLRKLLWRGACSLSAKMEQVRVPPGWPLGSILSFLSLACVLGIAHGPESQKTLAHFRNAQPPSREMTAELACELPTVAAGSRILFLDDPFPPGDYNLLFLVRLLYDDLTLEIGRRKAGAVPPEDNEPYDLAFTFTGGRLVRVPVPDAAP